MGKTNVAVECNVEHRASVYALVTSIVANKSTSSRYCIYMLFNDSDRPIWNDILSLSGENVEIIFFDKSLSELKGVGKLIYFKWNALVMGDLSEFYHMDLEEKSFAAAENLPCKEYVVPEGCEEINTSVLLLDTDKTPEASDYKKFSVFYNYGYEEFVRNKDKILNIQLGMDSKEYADLRDWALILRTDQDISPEKYFDSPLAQLWMKYYKLSPMGMEPLRREAYAETMGDVHTRDANAIPILLCVDDKNVVYATDLIVSLEANLDKDRTLDIRLVYNQLSLEHKKMLMEMSSQRVKIVLYNIQSYTLKQYRTCKEVIASYVFADYAKAICLDTKLVCKDDISSLYDLDMEDYLIRARQAVYSLENQETVDREDIYFKNITGIDTNVSIVNVKRWIENNINEQVQELLNSDNYKKYSEQDILNIICMKQRAFIGEEFKISVCKEQAEPDQGDDDVREVLVELQKLQADNKQLQEANQKLKAENKKLSVQNKQLSTERERFLYEILEIRKSITYKVGRVLTLIPRKLRGDK